MTIKMPLEKIRAFGQNFEGDKKDWYYLGIVLSVSLSVKLFLLGILYSTPINNDGILYINAARQYALGNFSQGLRIYPMPAYPLLLALIHTMVQNWILSGFLISIMSMVLALIPIYFLTKMIFNARAGFFASLFFALIPKMNSWSLYIIRDPLFLLITLLCIYVALKAISRRSTALVAAGFILAWAATLIRIEGVLFIVFYFFCLIYLAFFKKEHTRQYVAWSAAWAFIPIGLAMLVLLSSGVRSMAVNRFDYVSVEVMDLLRGGFLDKPLQIYKFLEEAGAHPPFYHGHNNFAALCRHFMPIIYMLGIVKILIKILLPFSFIPIYFGFRGRFNFSGRFILLLCFAFSGLAFYFLIKHDLIATRYLMVPSCLLLPWLGAGIDILWSKAMDSKNKKIILILIFLIILTPAAKTFSLISARDSTTINAARWISEKYGKKEVKIVSNSVKILFYIDLEVKDDSKIKSYYYDRRKTTRSIEEKAEEEAADLIVIRAETRKIDLVVIKTFGRIAAFSGRKHTILIYGKKEAD